jgi:hypothetical protein
MGNIVSAKNRSDKLIFRISRACENVREEPKKFRNTANELGSF